MSSSNQRAAPVLNTREAAEYLSISEAGMNRWRQRGGGPAYVRIGGRTIRYRATDLDAFLASCVITEKEAEC